MKEILQKAEGLPLVGNAIRGLRIRMREEELARDLCWERWRLKGELGYDEMMRELRHVARAEGVDIDRTLWKASKWWNPSGSV